MRLPSSLLYRTTTMFEQLWYIKLTTSNALHETVSLGNAFRCVDLNVPEVDSVNVNALSSGATCILQEPKACWPTSTERLPSFSVD